MSEGKGGESVIIQALNNYYKRLLRDTDIEVPEFGFGIQGVHFCLTIDREGNLKDAPIDLRNDLKPLRIEVPGPVKRASGISPNFAWDNTGYVLGKDDKGKPERTIETHKAFKTLVFNVLRGSKDEGANALMSFLAHWTPDRAEDLPGWEQIVGWNVVFRLNGAREFLHQRPALRMAWRNYLKANRSRDIGMCLVTGKKNVPISKVHAAIKGVPGAQATGAALISFNVDSAISYGKEQNLCAPVSEQAAFAYTTALNSLLSPGSNRKIQIGDTTVVFWTDKPAVEKFFGLALGGNFTEEENSVIKIEQYLNSIISGNYPDDFGDKNAPFFVLGLSPNAARLSVRFWYAGKVGSVVTNIGEHFHEMELRKSFDSDPQYLCPWWLLKELAPQRDSHNISPLLSGQLITSIVQNRLYSQVLLTSALGRIRADKKVNHLRACILKAYLTRNIKQEIHMSLDKNNIDVGYLLGRLFAILERIQEEAVSGAKTTIRDRYFGLASATPGRIFPVILKNTPHSLAKIRKKNPGLDILYEKKIEEILGVLDAAKGFPSTLSLEKQGMFVLGYYQQRQALFTKKEEVRES